MKTLKLVQGSAEWHGVRANCFTASEAPAMMGESKYQTRSALLRAKATGVTPDIDEQTQRRFDEGHAAEAAARPIVEEMIGEELYPATATDDTGRLLASFDGITLMNDVIYEHKLWNEELAAQVRARELDPMYYWQLEHQLLVSSAVRCVFVVSDGTRERFEWMEYTAVPGRSARLLAGWKQFEKDLAEYSPSEPAAEAVGRAPMSLPALRIELVGQVTASNLADFKNHAIDVFKSIRTDLQTDQDFADAEQTVKWCGDIEERLAAAKQHALSQTQSIDELFRAIDAISGEARAKRLALDKLVKARKEAIRGEIVAKARAAYLEHERACQQETGGAWLVILPPDFNGAIKGKRSIVSMQDAVDTLLANSKIAATESTRRIRAAFAALDDESKGFEHLFADRNQFAGKTPDDVRAIARGRIAEHRLREEARLEQERERIRREEAARVEREQASKESAGEEARAAAEPSPRPAAARADLPRSAGAAPMPTAARIKLGDINARIAPLSISAEGLANLGFRSVGRERAAMLYAESDFPLICHRLSGVLVDAAKKKAA